MVIVKLLVNVDVYRGMTLKAGEEYVMAGGVMQQLQKMYPGSLHQTRNFEDEYRHIQLNNLKSTDKICMFRSGGIGDIMFMLPLMKHLKEKYGVSISVGTSPMYTDILENNPHVDEVFQMPFNVSYIENSDYHIKFEGIIEDASEKSQVLHAVDLFLEHSGVDFTTVSSDDKCPKLFLGDSERIDFQQELYTLGLSGEATKIGIQAQASSPIRNFPLDKTVAIINSLLDRGDKVVFFGGRNQLDISHHMRMAIGKKRNFIDYISADRSLRSSILMASSMDLMVAPDSSFIHIAGGLGVPVVGLYGCFPSLLRMKYYKNAIGIDCNVTCAPSFIHGHGSCGRGNPSPCFSVIKPEDVINAIDHLLMDKSIKNIYPTFNEFTGGELNDSPFSTMRN